MPTMFPGGCIAEIVRFVKQKTQDGEEGKVRNLQEVLTLPQMCNIRRCLSASGSLLLTSGFFWYSRV